MSKARNYCFTINNYTAKSRKDFERVAQSLDKHNYIAYAFEIAPTTGTKHIQAYIQLTDSQRFSFLHSYFSLVHRGKPVKFHCEVAKGTQEQNLAYVSKDGDYVEYGTPKEQGKRTDLVEIKEKLQENPRILNKLVYEDVTNYQQLKFAENIQRYCFSSRNPDNPPVVYWLYGKSGIGKTKLVYDSFSDICNVSDYGWLGTEYQQNTCFLLDDFRKSDLPFHTLLKLTDRYPYTLFLKGGSIPLNSPYIVITSPKSIDDTYSDHNEDLTQLKRRIIQIDLDLNQIENLSHFDSGKLISSIPKHQAVSQQDDLDFDDPRW